MHNITSILDWKAEQETNFAFHLLGGFLAPRKSNVSPIAKHASETNYSGLTDKAGSFFKTLGMTESDGIQNAYNRAHL